MGLAEVQAGLHSGRFRLSTQPRKRGRFVPNTTRSAGFAGRFRKSNKELKFLDVSVANAAIPVTGSIQTGGTLLVIPQNLTDKGRIGRSLVVRDLEWRGTLTIPEVEGSVNPPQSDVTRMIVYLDKQSNKATASVTNILETAAIDAPFNLENEGRFTVLWDKVITIDRSTFTQTAANVFAGAEHIRKFHYGKKTNIKIEYSGVDGTLDELTSNNLAVLLISKNAIIALTSNFRIRYTDS